MSARTHDMHQAVGQYLTSLGMLPNPRFEHQWDGGWEGKTVRVSLTEDTWLVFSMQMTLDLEVLARTPRLTRPVREAVDIADPALSNVSIYGAEATARAFFNLATRRVLAESSYGIRITKGRVLAGWWRPMSTYGSLRARPTREEPRPQPSLPAEMTSRIPSLLRQLRFLVHRADTLGTVVERLREIWLQDPNGAVAAGALKCLRGPDAEPWWDAQRKVETLALGFAPASLPDRAAELARGWLSDPDRGVRIAACICLGNEVGAAEPDLLAFASAHPALMLRASEPTLLRLLRIEGTPATMRRDLVLRLAEDGTPGSLETLSSLTKGLFRNRDLSELAEAALAKIRERRGPLRSEGAVSVAGQDEVSGRLSIAHEVHGRSGAKRQHQSED